MKRIGVGVIAGAMIALCASAQGGAQENAPPPPPDMAGPGGLHRPGGMSPMGMGMRGKLVAGAPYSADVTTSEVQVLADGNKISRTNTGHVARDSQGRTYLQQTLAPGPWAGNRPTTITFLSDPVAGYTYVLNPANKTAMRREFRPRGSRDAARPPKPGGGPWDEASQRSEADLGQMDIDGLTATGKRITRTIPAGAIGNAQPIVEKSEIWTAPDLQVVVKSTHSDPRSGQSTYALTNMARTEPNASLFQVPAGYTVEDAPAPRGLR